MRSPHISLGGARDWLTQNYAKMLAVLFFCAVVWYVRAHDSRTLADIHKKSVEAIVDRLDGIERHHAVESAVTLLPPVAPPIERQLKLELGSAREKLQLAHEIMANKQHMRADCALTFSINTGRTGSAYLAHVLSFAAELDVHHEASPDMAGRTLIEAKERGLKRTYHERFMKKVIAIRRRMYARPHLRYVETSHLFAKTFEDVVMDEFYSNRRCDVRIIVMRRRIEDIAFSLARLNFDAMLHDWYYTPGDKIAVLNPIAMADESERIAGYLYDVEAHVMQFRERYPEVPITEVYLEDITSPAGVRQLYTQLSLNTTHLPQDSVLVSRLKPVNTKESVRPGVYATSAEAELRIRSKIIDGLLKFRQRYVAKYGDKGLPTLPSLDKRFTL